MSPLPRRSEPGRESLLDVIEALRDQRDALYTSTVNPRRNAARALKVLNGQDMGGITAEEFIADVAEDLEQLAALYRDYTKGEDA